MKIENGELKIIFFPSFIHGTCLATVEAQRAAPHNDVSHNPIIINNIPNIFIVLFVVLSCRFGVEAQHAAPHNDVSHNPITINNIPNIFIVLFVVFSCRAGMEAQHAAPLLAFQTQRGIKYPV